MNYLKAISKVSKSWSSSTWKTYLKSWIRKSSWWWGIKLFWSAKSWAKYWNKTVIKQIM